MAVIAITAGVYFLVNSSASSSLVFDGGFETNDLSEWEAQGSVQMCNTNEYPPFPSVGGKYPACDRADQTTTRISTVSSPTDNSKYAGKFTIYPNDQAGNSPGQYKNRVEVGCTKDGLPCRATVDSIVNQERWYGWSTYFPDEYDFYAVGESGVPDGGKWQILMQLNTPGTTPQVAVGVVEDELNLHLTGPDHAFIYLNKTPITKNKWYRIVMKVKFSPDPTVGYVEYWLDGKRILLAQPGNAPPAYRRYAKTIQTFTWADAAKTSEKWLPSDSAAGMLGEFLVKLGIYRRTGTGVKQVLYHDNFRVGKSFEAVDPGN